MTDDERIADRVEKAMLGWEECRQCKSMVDPDGVCGRDADDKIHCISCVQGAEGIKWPFLTIRGPGRNVYFQNIAQCPKIKK